MAAPDTQTPDPTPDAVVAAFPGAAEVAVYSGDEQAPPMPQRRAVMALIVLACAAFVFSSNETSVMGVISVAADDLDRSEAAFGLMTTAFALVNMLCSIPAALVLRRLPRRAVLSGTAALLTVGLVVVATAPNFGWLLVGRGATGLAHAAFWAIVTPTVAGMFASKDRGKSVSRLLLGGTVSGILGLPLVTMLAQNVSWRAPYWVLAGMALVISIAIYVVMPSFRAEQGTAARGLIPSWPIFMRILVVCTLTISSIALTWTFIAPFATEVAGFSDSAVPTLLLIGGASGLVAMYLVARYLDRYPVKSVALGLASLVTLWALMGTLGHLRPVLVVCVVLQGFANSILIAAMVNWAIRHAPGSTDIANGTYATSFSGGNAIGSLAGAALLASFGAAWLPIASLVVTLASATLVWTMRGASMRGLRLPMARSDAVQSPTQPPPR